jgi:hypothetical protein
MTAAITFAPWALGDRRPLFYLPKQMQKISDMY